LVSIFEIGSDNVCVAMFPRRFALCSKVREIVRGRFFRMCVEGVYFTLW